MREKDFINVISAKDRVGSSGFSKSFVGDSKSKLAGYREAIGAENPTSGVEHVEDKGKLESSREMELMATRLFDSVPAQLRLFKENWHKNPSGESFENLTVKLAKEIHGRRQSTGKLRNYLTDQGWPQKDLSEIGFGSVRDAREKIALLNQAWEGLVKVEVEGEDNGTTADFVFVPA